MRKDLKLVLSVFEGHGWRPREGHKAIVTAKLENHVVTTDPVVLTTEPKFFTELSWKLKPNLIRQYKVARVPIRVECLSVSKHGEHQSLGYIIVPLSTAVLGAKSEGKWFKLLGGRSSPHKNPPSLSLSLCLRDPEIEDDEIVLSDDEEQVTDTHHGLKNGPREDHSFQKGISPRNVASRSPRRSLNSSHSPRTQNLQPSPRRSSRRLQDVNVYEEINENGTEMEVDEKYIKLEGIPAHHRNNHNSPMSLSREHELNHSQGSGSHSHRNRHHDSIEIMPNCIDARDTQLKPQHNQDGGFFQIGPSNSPGEESFVLSITIVFAKNLDQLFPKEFSKTAEPACFSYSLLGCTIKTDAIDINNPNFLAERAAGNIRSTGANLSAYFHKNSELPVHLLVGDLCLASTCINLSVFENAAELALHNNTLTVEGGFPLVPLVSDPSDIEANKDPILGIVAELSRVSTSDVSVRHPSTLAKMKMEKVFLNSLSEASSNDEDMDHQRQVCSTQRRQNSFTGEMLEQKELASEIHKQRLQLLYAAAIEVETWKEDQQELFWKQWCARESELQQHLAAEWRVRVNSIEGNLQNQLAKCDTLQNRLTSALTNLSAREVIVKNREKKLKQLEDELEEQRQILKERDKGSTAEGRNLANDDVWEELVMERRSRRALEKQVEELKGRALLAETKLKEDEKLTAEASRLQREKEKLSEQLAAAVSRKQFYKLQWVRAVSQLHQLHVAQAHDTLAIKSEVTRGSSPEPFHPSPARMESLEDESLEEHVLFLEPSRDARGNKVSPKNLHVQRKSGNGIVSEKASSHRQERHAEEEYEPRRRSGSSSRLGSRKDEIISRTRKRIGSETGNRSNECIQLDVSGTRKRTLQTSLNRSKQEELGSDESEDERIGKSPRLSRMNRSHELERLMKERENLLETSDLDLYESRIQSVEKKIREVVEL